MLAPSDSPRLLARSLSGYLCGTHSGVLAPRRGDRLDCAGVARAHGELPVTATGSTMRLGELGWEPTAEAAALAATLRRSLDRPEVVDLIVFGSHARRSATGFSDLDAILVIDDAAADNPSVLRALRRHVLAAQRAVFAFQPMQHHGFELATPRLLARANETLAMPAVALSETRSLMGRGAGAAFAPDPPEESRARLSELVSATTAVRAWPWHPWSLHVVVSMFELLPALYLQARGEPVPKWSSFGHAQEHFGEAWWPYEVLERLRNEWIRHSSHALRATVAALRNPWAFVAAWRRVPTARPQPARRLLTDECLAGLRGLATEMRDRT